MKIRRKISLLVMAIMSFISGLSLTSCGGLKQHEEAFVEALKINIIPESAHPETVTIKNFKESYCDGAIVFFYLEAKNVNDIWSTISLVVVTEDIQLSDYTNHTEAYYASSVEKGFYCVNYEVENWYDTENETHKKLSTLSLLTETGLIEKDTLEYNVDSINKSLSKYLSATYPQ